MPARSAPDGGRGETGQRRSTGDDRAGHDRQVLVVGRDLAGAVTAGFLEQAGLDPVLAPGTPRAHRSVVPIWEPGLTLLARLGLRRPVERLGTRLDGLSCVTSEDSWHTETAGRPSLVAIQRDTLDSIVERHLLGRIRTADQTVSELELAENGVRATFDRGVKESFDTVVTTDRSLYPVTNTDESGTTVHWWTFQLPDNVSVPDSPTEAWDDDGLAAFTMPVEDTTRATLVATATAKPRQTIAPDDLQATFGPLSTMVADALAALEQSQLQYRRVPYATPRSLSVETVALVGAESHATVPGGCLQPALALEDAWVVADTLAYGPASLDAALEAYTHRRRRRLRTISTALRDATLGNRVPLSLPPILQHLAATRTLAFGHCIESSPREHAREIPDRL